jgi:hypothetical protein
MHFVFKLFFFDYEGKLMELPTVSSMWSGLTPISKALRGQNPFLTKHGMIEERRPTSKD